MLDSRSQLPLAESAAGAVRLKLVPTLLVVLAGALWLARPAIAAGEILAQPEEVSRAVIVQNLSVQGDRVAGVIANLSERPIKELRLQMVFSWLWADEHRQGPDDPSLVATEVIRDEIPPRGQVTFGYSYPSANTARTDGSFIVDVKIVGFRIGGETQTVPVPVP